MKWLGAILVALILVATRPGAAEAERRVALVIGNGDYASVGFLKNPVNDASDVAAALKRVGFDVMTGIDLKGDALAEKVEDFGEALGQADVALFYYAGHGIQIDGQNYLLPVDTTAESEISLKRQAVALSDVVTQMEAGAKVNLIFLDACRDNPLAALLKKRLSASGRSAAVERGLAPVATRSGETLVVFATAPGRTAADGKGRNSPFTGAFLEHIDAPGIEIETLMKRVTKAVLDATEEAQEPQRLSKMTVEFYFAPATGNAPAATVTIQPDKTDAFESETAFWRGIEGSQSRDDFEAYLEKVAASEFSGLFADLARKRLASLEPSASDSGDARTAELPPFAAIAEKGPTRIVTKGYNGPTYVEGSFTRTEIDIWEEQNSEAGDHILTFQTKEQTADRILLFDESRKLWLRIDLARKKTAWRLDGQTRWNPLYDIVAVER